ncbi:Uncharacterised protein [Mycobacterium tuberculosis]|nr:Uncharacterised protein [Mycobacterium tuberculosis]
MIEPPLPPLMRCGTPAFTVFHTPDKLTSIISCQSCSLHWSRVSPPLPMPALATMMSSRPSSSTPASTAAFIAS